MLALLGDGAVELLLLLVELVDDALALALLLLEAVVLLARRGEGLVLLLVREVELPAVSAEGLLFLLDGEPLGAQVLGVVGGVAHAAVELVEVARHEYEAPLVLQQAVAVHVEERAAVLLLAGGEVGGETVGLALQHADAAVERVDLLLVSVHYLPLLVYLAVDDGQIAELRVHVLPGRAEQLFGVGYLLLERGALLLQLLDALAGLRVGGRGGEEEHDGGEEVSVELGEVHFRLTLSGVSGWRPARRTGGGAGRRPRGGCICRKGGCGFPIHRRCSDARAAC